MRPPKNNSIVPYNTIVIAQALRMSFFRVQKELPTRSSRARSISKLDSRLPRTVRGQKA
jgi:hypothetical protein